MFYFWVLNNQKKPINKLDIHSRVKFKNYHRLLNNRHLQPSNIIDMCDICSVELNISIFY
jgi:hypothetical protein